MTSLAGEIKYLKQVKIQGTLKHFWEGKKIGLIVPLNLLESIYGNEFFFSFSTEKRAIFRFEVASKSIIF